MRTYEKNIIAYCEMRLSGTTEKIQKFKSELDTHPLYAFEWGMSALEAAAKKQVFLQVKTALESGSTMEAITNHARNKMLHMARHPKRSTSPLTNLAHEEELAAWTDLYEMLLDAEYNEYLE